MKLESTGDATFRRYYESYVIRNLYATLWQDLQSLQNFSLSLPVWSNWLIWLQDDLRDITKSEYSNKEERLQE